MKTADSHQVQNVLKNKAETVMSTGMALSSCYRPETGSVKGCRQHRPDPLQALAGLTFSQFRTFFI